MAHAHNAGNPKRKGIGQTDLAKKVSDRIGDMVRACLVEWRAELVGLAPSNFQSEAMTVWNLANPGSRRAGGLSQRICIAFVTHVMTPAILAAYERLAREVPADHDVILLMSCDEAFPPSAIPVKGEVMRISRGEALRPDYVEKCRQHRWSMIGNLDLVMLEFWRRRLFYDRFWFVEYDVHWVGNWRVLFEHFRDSEADVLGTSMMPIDLVPHKLEALHPTLVVPSGMVWHRNDIIKGFLPICRLTWLGLHALDAAYRAGLGGHYEILVPTVAAQAGLSVEDIGGRGPFVRPENRHRFYFAHSGNYSHSPGSFVFRPEPKVLPFENTLWHPVKPGVVEVLHPMRVRGTAAKNVIERLKPWLWHCVIWLWFRTRWRTLRDQALILDKPARNAIAARGAQTRTVNLEHYS